MASEPQGGTGRPRTSLLVLLGLAVLALIVSAMWPSGSTPASSLTPGPARPASARQQAPVNPADLDVRLDALTSSRPRPGIAERNPFRFQPKPSPPVRPLPPAPPPVGPSSAPLPQGPPPLPAIPLKFFGTVEKPGMKVAALSDCRVTYQGREGEIIDGRYRLIRIGVESVVIEYADGRGRTTLRLEGCPPR